MRSFHILFHSAFLLFPFIANSSMPSVEIVDNSGLLFQSNLPTNTKFDRSYYKDLLIHLVNINTGSENLEGIKKAHNVLTSEFAKLNFVEKTRILPNSDRRVFVYEHKNAEKPDVALVGHLDTVFEPSHKFQVAIDNPDRIIGPGIIDMKSGIVLMLAVINRIEDPALLKRIQIIINDYEESGSQEVSDEIMYLAKDKKYAIVYEPGMEDGGVITSHSGVHWMQIAIKGKPAHAGLEPFNGVNACHEMIQKVYALDKMNDYQAGVYVNPGVLSGGTKPNIICENASIKLDIRFCENDQLEPAIRQIKEIAKKSHSKSKIISDFEAVKNEILNSDFTVTVSDIGVPYMSVSEKSSQLLFELIKKSAAKLNQKIEKYNAGFATDGGFFAKAGVNVIVGTGPYGKGMHTDQEFMLKRSFDDRLELNLDLLKKLP